jgi:hypothetical protein
MKRVLKKGLCVILTVMLILSGIGSLNVPKVSATSTAIPVAVEANGFNSTLVNGSTTGSSLILTTDNAGLDGSNLMLTPNLGSQKGTAVRRNRMLLSNSGFSTYYKMHITPGGSPGDGLCFIVYQSDTDTTQTGALGEGLGYSGIPNSIGVEFDTYQNSSPENDPSSPHVAIDTNGSVIHAGTASSTATGNGCTDDGAVNMAHTYSSMLNNDINVWVDYDGSTGYITVTWGTSSLRASSSNYSFKRNVGTSLVGKNVFVGFSASTGGATEKNDILKWYFSNNYVTGGLSDSAGVYSQAASTISVGLNGTGTNNATHPTTAAISLKDTNGNAMINQDFKIAIGGTDTGTTYNTGLSGTYNYSISPSLAAGSHTLTATSADGSVVKSVAFTSPAGAPSISAQPQSATTGVGSTANFFVTASSPDSGTLSYQWQYSTNSGGTWFNVTGGSGATSASYTTGTLALSDSGKEYHCVMTNTNNGQTASTTSSAATLTVNKQSPSLSIPSASPSSSQTCPGNVTLSSTLSSYYGTLSGQTVTFWNGATQIGSATTNSSGIASMTWSNPGAGGYSITAQFAGDGNNNAATSGALSYSVNKGAQATLSIANPGSKTYGDSSFRLSVSGGSGSGSLSYSSGNTGVLTVDSGGNVTIHGAGSATVTVTREADANYNAANQTIGISVAKKTLNAVITPNNKTYDSTTAATISTFAYNSFGYSDTASDVYITGGSLSFSNESVGDAKTVTAAGYTLAGGKEANYSLGTVTAQTANITKATLTVTGTAVKDKTYDGTTSAEFSGTPSLSGVISGDGVTLTGGTGTFVSKDYSANPITVNLLGFGLSGAYASNYTLTQPAPVSAKIHQKVLNVSVSPVSILCGQQIPTLTANVSGFTSGESESNVIGFATPTVSQNYGSTTTTVTNASLLVTYSGGNATNNYTFSYSNPTTLNIQSIPVTDGDYQVSPSHNSASWNNSDLTITPIKDGFDLISADGTSWSPALTVSSEGLNGSVTFMLSRSTDGAQTESKTIHYNLDKTKPTGMTVKVHNNSFTSFLHTITFGLFFSNIVDVTLSANDALSGIDHYEYQLVDTSKGQSYDENGSWISTGSGAFSINPQFKGAIYVRAIDNAGNVSSVVSSDGLVVDNVQPTTPTVTATVDGKAYGNTWESKDIVIVASNSQALSGIAYYQYKAASDSTWSNMPFSTGATDSTSGNVVNNKLVIDFTIATTYSFRAVSNSGIVSPVTTLLIKHDNTIPTVNVSSTGTVNAWTRNAVDFTIANTNDAVLCTVSYWIKIGSASWTQLPSNTYTFNSEINSPVNFKVVTAAGVENVDPVTYNVMIDKTLPVISGASNAGSYYIGRVITLNDAFGEVNNATYSLNGGAPGALTSGTQLTAAGSYTVIVYDKAGNSSSISFAIAAFPQVSDIVYTSTCHDLITAIRAEFATHNDLIDPYKTQTDDAIKALEGRYTLLDNQVKAIMDETATIKSNVDNLSPVNDGLIAMKSTIQAEYDKIAGSSSTLTTEQKAALSTQKDYLKSLLDAITVLETQDTNIIDRTTAVPKANDGLITQTDTINKILSDISKLTKEQQAILKPQSDELNALLGTISTLNGQDAAIVTRTNNIPKDDNGLIAQQAAIQSILDDAAKLTKEQQAILKPQSDELNALLGTISTLNGQDVAIVTRTNNIPKDDNGLIAQQAAIQSILDDAAKLTTEQQAILKPQTDILIGLLNKIATLKGQDADIVTRTNNIPTANDGLIVQQAAIQSILDDAAKLTTEQQAILKPQTDILTGLLNKIATLKAQDADIVTRTNSIPTANDGLIAQQATIQKILDDTSKLTPEQQTTLKPQKDALNVLLGNIATLKSQDDAITTRISNVPKADNGIIAQQATIQKILDDTSKLTKEQQDLLKPQTDVLNELLANIGTKDQQVNDIIKRSLAVPTTEDGLIAQKDTIQSILDDASKLTNEQQNSIKASVTELTGLLNKITALSNQVTTAQAAVKALPDADKLVKADAQKVNTAKELYGKLNKEQKTLFGDSALSRLNDIVTAMVKLMLYDAPNDVTVVGIDGTTFSPNTILVVTPITNSGTTTNQAQFSTAATSITKAQANNDLLKGKELVALYDVSILKDNVKIEPDGKVQVKIKIPDNMLSRVGLEIVHIADDGTVTVMHTTNDGKYLTFITDHFSKYAIVAKDTCLFGICKALGIYETDGGTCVDWVFIAAACLIILSAGFFIFKKVRKSRDAK